MQSAMKWILMAAVMLWTCPGLAQAGGRVVLPKAGVKTVVTIPAPAAAGAAAPKVVETAKPAVSLSTTATSTPAVVAPVLPGEPQTPAAALESARQGLEFAKAKNWWGLSSIIILVLVWVLKLTKVFEKIGRRWLYILVPGLGVIAMLLAALAGGVSWGAAWLVLTSAPCAALLSDLVKRGILGQEPTNPIRIPPA